MEIIMPSFRVRVALEGHRRFTALSSVRPTMAEWLLVPALFGNDTGSFLHIGEHGIGG